MNWLDGAVGGYLGSMAGAALGPGGAIAGGGGGFILGSGALSHDSGNGVTGRSLRDIFGDDEIALFAKTDFGGHDDDRELRALVSGNANFDNVTGNLVGYSSSETQNIANKFMAWKRSKDKSDAEHEAYVNKSAQSPGRQATIIKPQDPALISTPQNVSLV